MTRFPPSIVSALSFTVPLLVLASGLLLSGAEKDCTFLKNPDEFRITSERTNTMRSDLTSRLAMYVYGVRLADPIDPIDAGARRQSAWPGMPAGSKLAA